MKTIALIIKTSKPIKLKNKKQVFQKMMEIFAKNIDNKEHGVIKWELME